MVRESLDVCKLQILHNFLAKVVEDERILIHRNPFLCIFFFFQIETKSFVNINYSGRNVLHFAVIDWAQTFCNFFICSSTKAADAKTCNRIKEENDNQIQMKSFGIRFQLNVRRLLIGFRLKSFLSCGGMQALLYLNSYDSLLILVLFYFLLRSAVVLFVFRFSVSQSTFVCKFPSKCDTQIFVMDCAIRNDGQC